MTGDHRRPTDVSRGYVGLTVAAVLFVALVMWLVLTVGIVQ